MKIFILSDNSVDTARRLSIGARTRVTVDADALRKPSGINQLNRNPDIDFYISLVFQGKALPLSMNDYKPKLLKVVNECTHKPAMVVVENEAGYNMQNSSVSMLADMYHENAAAWKGCKIATSGIVMPAVNVLVWEWLDQHEKDYRANKIKEVLRPFSRATDFYKTELELIKSRNIPVSVLNWHYHLDCNNIETFPIVAQIMTRIAEENNMIAMCGELSFAEANVSHLDRALEAVKKYDHVGLYNAKGAQEICEVFTPEMEEAIIKLVY